MAFVRFVVNETIPQDVPDTFEKIFDLLSSAIRRAWKLSKSQLSGYSLG